MTSRHLAVLLGVAWFATAPSVSADTEAARHAVESGNRAFAVGDLAAAQAAYARAWREKQSYSIACKLGRTEALLGSHPAAAQHLTYCIDHFTDTSEVELEELEPRFRKLLQETRARVGELTITTEPRGAELLVDGAPLPPDAPRSRLFVPPGHHTVSATLDGYASASTTLVVAAGATESVTLRLQPEPAQPMATTAPAHPSPAVVAAPPNAISQDQVSRPRPRPLAIPLVGTVITLASAGAGIGLTASASSSNLEDPSSLRRAAGLAFVGAGIAAAGSVTTWVLWPRRTPAADDAAWAVGAWPKDRGAGVAVRVSF